MNSEVELITAICKNGDINAVLQENPDTLFVTHGDVWETLKDYWYQYKEVPDVSILEETHRDFEPADVKGDTKYYLDRMRNDFIRANMRKLITTGARSLEELPAQQVLENFYSKLSELGKMTNSVRDVDLINYESAEEYFRIQRERAAAMGGSPGIPTGFKAMDASYPTGMAPGHLIVLIGWSGRGKTWFSSYLACKAWEQGFKPMIVSLEMSPENMRDRIYTVMGEGRFRNSDFSSGNIDLESFNSWAQKKFSKSNNFIIVSSEGADSITPNTVQSKIDQHRPDLVVLDYHQLFDDNKHSRSEVERNRNISREFKLLAVRNNIPIVDLSQATQDDVSDTEEAPMIEQVAWSKGIQHDADLAIAVHKQANSNLFEIINRKSRHGPEFAFELDWDIDQGIIKELV